MAVLAIPNPVKKLNLDFSILETKKAITNVQLLKKEYVLKDVNDVFNQFTFEAFEFLSLGVYIDVSLNSITDSKTEVTIEIRRKLGSFNQSHEITLANKHIETITNLISKSIMLTDENIENLKLNNSTVKQNFSNQKSKTTAIVLCFFFGGLGIHRFYLGYTLYGIIQLFTFGGFGLWWLIDFILLITCKLKDSNNNLLK